VKAANKQLLIKPENLNILRIAQYDEENSMRTIRSSKLKSRLLLSLALLAATPLFAQTYVVGRTVDGQPDLQGLWTNDTITPIERPASMEGRAFLSEDEIASMEAGLAERRESSKLAAILVVIIKFGWILGTQYFLLVKPQ
jgi:hypothetical protein